MAYREFITAVAEKQAGGPESITFTIGKTDVDEDGVETVTKRDITAHPPKEGQIALMMARMGRHSSSSDKVAGIIDFFVEVMDQADHDYVVGRLLDREDPFGFNDVTQISTWLIEEWGQRPTK